MPPSVWKRAQGFAFAFCFNGSGIAHSFSCILEATTLCAKGGSAKLLQRSCWRWYVFYILPSLAGCANGRHVSVLFLNIFLVPMRCLFSSLCSYCLHSSWTVALTHHLFHRPQRMECQGSAASPRFSTYYCGFLLKTMSMKKHGDTWRHTHFKWGLSLARPLIVKE